MFERETAFFFFEGKIAVKFVSVKSSVLVV